MTPLQRQDLAVDAPAGKGTTSNDNIAVAFRMIAELTGKRYSSRNQHITAVGSIARGIAHLAEVEPAMAGPLVDRLLDVAAATLDGADLADALEAVVRALSDRAVPLSNAAERLTALIEGIDASEAAHWVWYTLATTLAALGSFDKALIVVDAMPKGERQAKALSEVEAHRQLAALESLSALKRYFLGGDDPEFKRIALLNLREERMSDLLLHVAAIALVEQASTIRRVKLMRTFAPVMLLRAHVGGGPTLMAQIVEGLDDWQQRFIEAVRLIGAST